MNISIDFAKDVDGSCSQCSNDHPMTLMLSIHDGFNGYGPVMPICLQCWNPNSPAILAVFEKRSRPQQLRHFSNAADQPIFNNWE